MPYYIGTQKREPIPEDCFVSKESLPPSAQARRPWRFPDAGRFPTSQVDGWRCRLGFEGLGFRV